MMPILTYESSDDFEGDEVVVLEHLDEGEG